MKKTALLIALAAVIAAPACNPKDDSILFDGQAFRGKASAVSKEDRRVFTATVSPVSASFDGAVEAAEFEGTKYCIENYGTSAILWTVGPQTPRESLVIDRDALTFQGSCRP